MGDNNVATTEYMIDDRNISEIMVDGIMKVLKRMKVGKAARSDGVSSEMLRADGGVMTSLMCRLPVSIGIHDSKRKKKSTNADHHRRRRPELPVFRGAKQIIGNTWTVKIESGIFRFVSDAPNRRATMHRSRTSVEMFSSRLAEFKQKYRGDFDIAPTTRANGGCASCRPRSRAVNSTRDE
ncbi:hypothetical protein EVAR_18030_1 [Eumeta japonica]|uniref:Uncharacterized protein n=1 Tax=Eumeta variegata TaxID=151549 RepID=A0A4C1XX60_EUMVA|nr:hypothetical protein EVAR_18030_1 [Eumeta japonica]